MLISKVLEHKHGITKVDDITVHHHHGEHEKKAGVHSITLSCKINGAELQLCEISIHDSASSQQYDELHYEIPHMRRMTEDTVYCPPEDLVHLDVYRIKIPVPNIERYCNQQLFTFVNKLKDGQYQKAFGSFRRVLFVLYLLEQVSHSQNANEKTRVKQQIGVSNIDRTMEEIHEMIHSVKDVVKEELKAICSSKHKDEAMMILCDQMKKPAINVRSMLQASAAPFTPRFSSALPPLAPKGSINPSARRSIRQNMQQSVRKSNKNTRKNANNQKN